jgi:hypothetical protein
VIEDYSEIWYFKKITIFEKEKIKLIRKLKINISIVDIKVTDLRKFEV